MRWNTSIDTGMLTLLGELAVVSAHMEELLHRLYWKHAGLDEKSGPIVTDNLNPKRLSEDIKKLVALDPAKAHILEDLKILLKEFEDINTKRNRCLHWIWDIVEQNDESIEGVTISGPYKVSRPVYKQAGIASQELDVKDIEEICRNGNWLNRRLYSHTLSENVLRNLRSLTKPFHPVVDIFWPAPWLDKPQPPNSTPSDHPETSK
jgi:hypothetical protein